MNIVIPASGQGQRFVNAGFNKPKPFVPVDQYMIIEHMLSVIPEKFSKSLIFTEQLIKENQTVIKKLEAHATILPIPSITDGPLRTAFNALQRMNLVQGPIAFFNSDMVVKCDYDKFSKKLEENDGAIITFIEPDKDVNHWSFIKEKDGFLTDIVEKRRISDTASLGVYGFKSADKFLSSAQQTFAYGKKQNNEWYFSSLYNDFLEKNEEVFCMSVDKTDVISLGTPFEVYKYMQSLLLAK